MWAEFRERNKDGAVPRMSNSRSLSLLRPEGQEEGTISLTLRELSGEGRLATAMAWGIRALLIPQGGNLGNRYPNLPLHSPSGFLLVLLTCLSHQHPEGPGDC